VLPPAMPKAKKKAAPEPTAPKQNEPRKPNGNGAVAVSEEKAVVDAPARDAVQWRSFVLPILVGCVYLLVLSRRWTFGWRNRIFGLSAELQELNLFSENAFYYSFFREVTDAPSFSAAVRGMVEDTRSEYPTTINAFSRFNIYQEVALGLVYRYVADVLPEVVTPFLFYSGALLVWSAVGVAALTFTVARLGRSELAGVFCGGLYTMMLAVPVSRAIGIHVIALRENFAVPLLQIAVAALTILVRSPGNRVAWAVCLVSSALFMVFWQFGPFVMLAQLVASYGVYLLGYDLCSFLRVVLVVHVLVGGLNTAALFFNPFVLHSVWFQGVVSVLVAHLAFLRSSRTTAQRWMEAGVALGVFAVVRAVMNLFNPDLDKHVYDMLADKLFRKAAPGTFDAAVYFNMNEFRSLLEPAVWQQEVQGVEPVFRALKVAYGLCCVALVASLLGFIRELYTKAKRDAAFPWHVAHLAVLTGMMTLVWRLRVLALPFACVFAALPLAPGLWEHAGLPRPLIRVLRLVLPLVSLGAAAYCATLYASTIGDLYASGLDPDTELDERVAQFKMLEFMNENLPLVGKSGRRTVVAGDAVTLSIVRMSTPFPVTAHPHYEHPFARQRFREAKEMLYGCAPPQEVYDYLVSLNVTHVLLDVLRLAPHQAIDLSKFYEPSRRCSASMGQGIMGDRRPFFHMVFGGGQTDPPLFRPEHVVGPLVLVKVMRPKATPRPTTRPVEPWVPDTWQLALDACKARRPVARCAEDLASAMRPWGSPMKNRPVVDAIRRVLEQNAPEWPGRSAFVVGEVMDYSFSDFQQAQTLYRTALKAQPDDLEIASFLGSLLNQVFKDTAGVKALALEYAVKLLAEAKTNPTVVGAQRMCQAASWLASAGVRGKETRRLWVAAKKISRHGCVQTNWELLEGKELPWTQRLWHFVAYPQ